MKRDIINGLKWILENDRFGFGVNWKNGDEPKTDEELAGIYITRTINMLETNCKKNAGHWIDERINSYTRRTYCSVCGGSAPFVFVADNYYGNSSHGETDKTKYCPNCGARMN